MATNDIAETLLESVKTIAIRAADTRQSLTEFARGARLEPMVMMDRQMTLLEPDILNGMIQTCLSLYTSYYLQFVSQHVSRIGNVTAQHILDPKLDDRKLVGVEALGEWDATEAMSLLDYTDYTETPTEFAVKHDVKKGNGNNGSTPMATRPNDAASKKERQEQVNNRIGDLKIDNDFAKPANLTVGKLIHVPITIGNQETTIPVSVRMNPRVVDSQHMSKVLEAFVGKDQSILGRWHRWRSGEISSVVDWMTGFSDAKKDAQLRLKDPDGTYKLIKANTAKGKINRLLTGKAGFQFASNAVVISKSTASVFERSMKMRFAQERGRSRFFKSTGSMLLVVVDDTHQRATMYQHGLEEVAVYNFHDFKAASTNPNSVNITEVLAAYKAAEAFS